MSDPEAERQIRREQSLVWGGGALIAAIVVVGAAMLAVGVPWYWTLLMIPVSAIGALMTFEGRASAHSRALSERLAEFERRAAEREERFEKAIMARFDQLDRLLSKLDNESERLKAQGTPSLGTPVTGQRQQRRTPNRSKSRGQTGKPLQVAKAAARPMDRIIEQHANVVDIEDARIMKRINDKFNGNDQGEDGG